MTNYLTEDRQSIRLLTDEEVAAVGGAGWWQDFKEIMSVAGVEIMGSVTSFVGSGLAILTGTGTTGAIIGTTATMTVALGAGAVILAIAGVYFAVQAIDEWNNYTLVPLCGC